MFGVQAWVGPQSTLRRYWGHMLKIHGTAPHSRHTSPSSLRRGRGVLSLRARTVEKAPLPSTKVGSASGAGSTRPEGYAPWLGHVASPACPRARAQPSLDLWPAARAKAPSRARRSAAQLAWEAAAAQRCRAPTGELVGRWPLAEAGSGGACPAKARRAARELLLSSATVVQGSALQAGSGAERASEPPCDVQHSGDCCVAASKTASWVPRAGRAARPAVAAADWTRHCHACGCAAPAFYHAWHCHARSPQSEWCRHQPPFVLSPQPSMRRREQLVDVAWMPTPRMPQRSRRTRHQRQPPAPRATLPPLYRQRRRSRPDHFSSVRDSVRDSSSRLSRQQVFFKRLVGCMQKGKQTRERCTRGVSSFLSFVSLDEKPKPLEIGAASTLKHAELDHARSQ